MKSTDVRFTPAIPTSQAGQVSALDQPPVAPRPAGQPLRAPQTTRQPLPDQANLQTTAREASSQLALRTSESRSRRQGTRQKKLKTEQIRDLGRLERPAFAQLVAHVSDILGRAQGAAGAEAQAELSRGAQWAQLDAGLAPLREELATAIQQAVRGPRSQLTKSGVDAMRASGTDTLMLQILSRGKLSMSIVRSEMTRLSQGLRDDSLSAADVKKGLVTADGLLQRLALAGAPLEYGFQNNGPRDLLLSFAASLHR